MNILIIECNEYEEAGRVYNALFDLGYDWFLYTGQKREKIWGKTWTWNHGYLFVDHLGERKVISVASCLSGLFRCIDGVKMISGEEFLEDPEYHLFLTLLEL